MVLRVKLVVLLSLIGFLSYGQGNTYTTFGSNVFISDFSGLNRQIKGIYPELENLILDYKFGIKVISSKSNIGIYGAYSMIPVENKRQKQTKFTGIGLGLEYEYNIISKPSFLLHPHLYLGLRKYNFVLGETSNGVSIEDVLNYEINNYKFENIGKFIELGMGVDKSMRLSSKKLWIGFSIGYRFDWGAWKYESINPVYHELAKLSGIVVSFSLKLGHSKILKEESD